MGRKDSTAQVKPRSASLEADDRQRTLRMALLAAIVESSDDAIVSKTLEGRILSWNQSATRIFGYQPEEVIGKPITTIIPPELHEQEREILGKLRRGECIDHFDTVRLAKDGRLIPVSLSISPVRSASGRIIGAAKIARDISERKRIEQVLRDSEERLTAEAGALVKLNEWSTRLWRSRNLAEGLEEMLAATIELLGADKGKVQLLDPERAVLRIAAHRGFQPAFLQFFSEVSAADDSGSARTLRSGARTIIEDVETDAAYAPYREAARAAGYRAVVSAPLISANGAALGVISTHFREPHRPTEQELRRLDVYLRQASDFIQRLKLEEGLRRSEEALRDADRRKDEFLALLAHELRNPLAPIRYALATAKKAGRTLAQKARAEEVIERQVAHMSRLLDDLLDISRITHGTMELKKARTDLASIVGAAVETARPIIDSKRHKLQVELPRQPLELEADAVRLAQVFSNLLINAAKYTEPGGRIELRGAHHAGVLTVSVRDDGMGISAEQMPRLFTLFSQAQASDADREAGLGIGLALVRGLVQLHGGDVSARSAGVGEGSEFTVRLPIDPSQAAALIKSDLKGPENTRALRVLVVDDSEDAADTCAILLELSGHSVRTAYTAHRALEVAERFRPQALLLDIGLPDLDGYQLARRIRTTAWGEHATIIAVTGWGQEQDKSRAFEAGFDHHLTKPIAPEVMARLLSAVPTQSVP
ncbi:MAG: PAS domain S-box protein [Gammaproteobacteria bacterium]|nr:PAS domain S-box protein [Gammaproteobacteria bacterium]